MSELSDWKRIVLPDELAAARARGKAEGIAEINGALDAARSTIAELQSERDQLTELLAIRSESGMAKDMQEIMRINNELQKRVGEMEESLEGTREALDEATAYHLEAQIARQAAEQALTAERQRRESAENVALPLSQGWHSYGGIEKDKAGLLRGTLAIWDFENAAKHFSRYANADDRSEEEKG